MSTLSWKELACLKAGGAICLPVILAGHALCQNYGLSSALIGIALGNAILLIMAFTMSQLSVQTRLTTTDNAFHYFGRYGTKGFAAALLFAKSSWVALQLNLMVISAQALLPIPAWILSILLGGLVIMVAMRGIRALSFVTALSLPLLLATMGYALYLNIDGTPIVKSTPLSFGGISLVIATAITAVIDMPTYFRHAKTAYDSAFAVFIFLGLAVPLIEGVGVALAYLHPGVTVLDTLRASDAPLWNIWVTLFLILAGWSTNNSNLFSASACMGTLTDLKETTRTLLIGCYAIVLSILGILDYFTTVLQLIGIMVGSMGSIMIMGYLLKAGQQHAFNLSLWAIGAIVGILSLFEIISLTGIPLIDACAVSTLGALMIRKQYETA